MSQTFILFRRVNIVRSNFSSSFSLQFPARQADPLLPDAGKLCAEVQQKTNKQTRKSANKNYTLGQLRLWQDTSLAAKNLKAGK